MRKRQNGIYKSAKMAKSLQDIKKQGKSKYTLNREFKFELFKLDLRKFESCH